MSGLEVHLEPGCEVWTKYGLGTLQDADVKDPQSTKLIFKQPFPEESLLFPDVSMVLIPQYRPCAVFTLSPRITEGDMARHHKLDQEVSLLDKAIRPQIRFLWTEKSSPFVPSAVPPAPASATPHGGAADSPYFPAFFPTMMKEVDMADIPIHAAWPGQYSSFSEKARPPLIHTFVAVTEDGSERYCVCYIRYTAAPAPVVVQIQKEAGAQILNGKRGDELFPRVLLWREVLCVVLKLPLFTFYSKVLSQVAGGLLDNIPTSGVTALAPLFASPHNVGKVPLIPPAIHHHDPATQFPPIEMDWAGAFRTNLSAANFLEVFAHILSENRVLLVSSQPEVLSPTIELLRALCYPIQWSMPCVAVLPSNHVADLLDVPGVWLFGVVREDFEPSFSKDIDASVLPKVEKIIPPDDVVKVDLDTGRVSRPAKFPSKLRKFLLDRLSHFLHANSAGAGSPSSAGSSSVASPSASLSASSPAAPPSSDSGTPAPVGFNGPIGLPMLSVGGLPTAERQVESCGPESKGPSLSHSDQQVQDLRSAFLDVVFVSLLRGYRASVTVVNRGHDMPPEAKFETDDFLRSFNDPEKKEFMARFVDTQLFHYFMESRLLQTKPDLFDNRVMERLNAHTKDTDTAMRKEFLGKKMIVRLNPLAMDFNFQLKANSYAFEYWFDPKDQHKIILVPGQTKVKSGGLKGKKWHTLNIFTPGVKHVFHFYFEDLRDEVLAVLKTRLRARSAEYEQFSRDAKLRWANSKVRRMDSKGRSLSNLLVLAGENKEKK